MSEDRLLVPGELRGYRQFQLLPDGLHPMVHRADGPWDGTLQRAVCAAGEPHAAPARDCRCGLYAWYLPGSATVCLGGWNAVIAARGRCVLGDRGFRAAAARIEAVALPASVRCWPPAARRARKVLAERYPTVRVHRSTGAMLAAFPPAELAALGIVPPPDRSRTYRRLLVGLFVLLVVTGYSGVVLPDHALAGVAARWWPVGVLLLVAWQAAVIRLVMALMDRQAFQPEPGAPP